MSAHPEEQHVPDPGDGRRELSRRDVVRRTALGVVAVPLVAACGSGGQAPSAGSGSGGDNASGSGPGSGSVKVPVGDVPVNGGTILQDAELVVTQPSKGEFKAFSAVCTHQGCLVNQVTDGRIVCPCHGSAFSIKDGSVLGGPAPKPLPEAQAAVKNGTVVVG